MFSSSRRRLKDWHDKPFIRRKMSVLLGRFMQMMFNLGEEGADKKLPKELRHLIVQGLNDQIHALRNLRRNEPGMGVPPDWALKTSIKRPLGKQGGPPPKSRSSIAPNSAGVATAMDHPNAPDNACFAAQPKAPPGARRVADAGMCGWSPLP